MLHKKLFLDFKLIDMVKENLLVPAAGRPQVIAFSMSEGRIVPWLLIGERWVRQREVPAGELVAIGLEKDLLTLKRSTDGISRN
jgi:hypothetical protein